MNLLTQTTRRDPEVSPAGSTTTGDLPEEVREKLLASIPLGRLGHPEEVARTAAFLAGPGGDYITGQVISVDGGMGM